MAEYGSENTANKDWQEKMARKSVPKTGRKSGSHFAKVGTENRANFWVFTNSFLKNWHVFPCQFFDRFSKIGTENRASFWINLGAFLQEYLDAPTALVNCRRDFSVRVSGMSLRAAYAVLESFPQLVFSQKIY